jgi:hypothetical protein
MPGGMRMFVNTSGRFCSNHAYGVIRELSFIIWIPWLRSRHPSEARERLRLVLQDIGSGRSLAPI